MLGRFKIEKIGCDSWTAKSPFPFAAVALVAHCNLHWAHVFFLTSSTSPLCE